MVFSENSAFYKVLIMGWLTKVEGAASEGGHQKPKKG